MFSEHQSSGSSHYRRSDSTAERMLDEALEEIREALEQSDFNHSSWREEKPAVDETEDIAVSYRPPNPHLSAPYPSEAPPAPQTWLKLLTGTAAVGLAVMLSIGGHEKAARVHTPPLPPSGDVSKEPKEQPRTVSPVEGSETPPIALDTPSNDPEHPQLVAAIMGGTANIKVHGKESFKSQVREALNKIVTVPEGLALIRELENNASGRKVFVKYGTDPSAGDCAAEPSLPCSPGDVVVEVKDLTREGMDAKLEFVLAHELDHARRFLNGEGAAEGRAKKPGFPNREEELAVDFENIIRRGLGASERRAYYHYNNVATHRVE